MLQCTTLLPICNLPFVSNSAGGGIVRSEPVLRLSSPPSLPRSLALPRQLSVFNFPAIPPNTMRALYSEKSEKTAVGSSLLLCYSKVDGKFFEEVEYIKVSFFLTLVQSKGIGFHIENKTLEKIDQNSLIAFLLLSLNMYHSLVELQKAL